MRIAFAGTPRFAATQLEALCQTSHTLVVVYTQPDKPQGRHQQIQESPVKILASQRKIPIIQPTSLKAPDAVARLMRYAPDVMVVAAYGLLLPELFLTAPPFGCINVHPSLLPRWRGASPISQAILAGDRETGVSLMRMNASLDGGNLLAQVPHPISPVDTTGSLEDTLATLSAKLLVSQLDTVVKALGTPQDEHYATYAPKRLKADAKMDWQLPALQLERHIRAYQPWPVAYTFQNHLAIRLFKAQVVPLLHEGLPGTIVAHHPEGPVVATQAGGLLLQEGQLPGKKRVPFRELLKGYPSLFAVGKHFEHS